MTTLRKGRQSIRTQLIFGSVAGLTLVLALFGFFVRYVVATTLMDAVDRNLQDRILQGQRRPPPRPGDHGPGGQRPGGPDQNGPGQPPFQFAGRQFPSDELGQGTQDGGQGGLLPPNQDQQGPPPRQQPGDQSPSQNQGPFDGQPDGVPNQGPPEDHGSFGGPRQQDGAPDQGLPPEQRPFGGPQQQDDEPNQGPPRDQGPFGGQRQQGQSSSTTPTAISILNQQDQLYRPRRFSIKGAALDRFNTAAPWDLAAIKAAALTDKPIYTMITLSHVHLRVLTEPVHPPHGVVWFFQAPYPMTETDRAIAGVDRALLTLIPIALLIAALGGALLTRSVLSRLGQMVHTAAGMSAQNLSQRLLVIGNDEFAELADTFNALLGRVETAFLEQARIVEQQRRFTADASHELKTPLTLIRGTTSLALSDNGILDRQSTEDIDNAAAAMSGLVQDLIYLARSDAGQLGRKTIDLLLLEPLQRAIDIISPISDAPIRLVAANEDLNVHADESDLVRLFSNVLQNAAYHTPKDGRIIVSLSSTATDAVVMISDSGVGIAPQHIEHLGERFYRVDSSRTRSAEIVGGSGLGLAICIVDAYHGTLNIESVLGKGTTVTITLPRSAACVELA